MSLSADLEHLSSTDDTSGELSTISSDDHRDSDSDHIKVCVRIRPLVRDERDKHEEFSWAWEDNVITQIRSASSSQAIVRKSSAIGTSGRVSDDCSPLHKQSYSCDYLFYPEHTNINIFTSVVKSVVSSAMDGYHGSVFTYGQTSSGKTFTMTGNPTQPGIIPQSVYHCFESVNATSSREFLLRVSYLEIYNEQVKDLLANKVDVPIKIQHDPKLGTVITGVREEVVATPEQVMALLKQGETHRHVGSTDMNEVSSRAHTLFKIIIESKERGDKGSAAVRVSALNLVDLAGSENAKMTNSKGERLMEAKYINQSLLTLSTIIHRLSEEKPGTAASKKKHLPYRDSKLTRLLQSSLDGNAQIALICAISPTLRCIEESHNTLKFAARAKRVRVSAKMNEFTDEKTLLRAYREEIEMLKARLFEMEMQTKLNNSSVVTANNSKKQQTENANNNANNVDTANPSPSKGINGNSNPNSKHITNNINQANKGEGGGGGVSQDVILQMIQDMEKLILKADRPRPAAAPATLKNKPQTAAMATAIATASTTVKIIKSPSTPPIAKQSSAMSPAAKLSIESAQSSSNTSANTSSNSGTANSTISSNAAGDKKSKESLIGRPSIIGRPSGISSLPISRLAKPTSNARASLSTGVIMPPPAMTTQATITNPPFPPPLPSTAVAQTVDAVLAPPRITSSSISSSSLLTVQPESKTVTSIPILTLEGTDSKIISMDGSVDVSTNTLITSAVAAVATVGKPIPAKDLSVEKSLSSIDSAGIAAATNNSAALKAGSMSKFGFSGAKIRPQYHAPSSSSSIAATIALDDLSRCKSPYKLSMEDLDDKSFEEGEDHDVVDRNHRRESSDDIGDRVLFGVSKMLAALKQQLYNNNNTNSNSSNSNSSNSSIIDTNISYNASTSSSSITIANDDTPALRGSITSSAEAVDSEEYNELLEKLKLDLKLKDADNRFLQDELNKKNRMLEMLTEGLREVEASQQQWHAANDQLLVENEWLHEEVNRLQDIIQEKDKSLAELSGDAMTEEEEEFY